MSATHLLDLLLAIVGGAVRVGTPFLFVSLGECLTEKSGRINLGLEGVLVFSAMAGFGGAYLSGSAWLGVLLAGCSGALLALLHGLLCSLPRVSDIATGIAMMLFGTGLAFYLGKPLIQPQAPQIAAFALGGWSASASVRSALSINALFPLGVALALVLTWGLRHTRWGLVLRMAGDSSDAARALGYSVQGVRIAATTAGGFIAGLGGASLSLYYPGSWAEGLSSGQGLIAVALVIFARWSPLRCLGAALLFGGAGAIGPALQSVGVTGGYYLFSAVPYALTLAILVATCSPRRAIKGAPAELGVMNR
ncbi:MAG: ABC transporter permease [Burkholderiales bacterium]|nr:ABC transporter permease [Burkholderiales bacterium]MDE1927855.1 ABC transporter permease [Burkholderiales bacterium]